MIPPTRDNLILDHIGLYRLTFRRTLERLFFEGASSGNVIQRLLDDGRIQARSGLPGRVRYYQLSPAEAATRGVPIARTRPLRSQALHQAIATLWHCCMESPRRIRLEPAELAALIEGFPKAPQAAHCLDTREVRDGEKSHRVQRLEVVGARTGVTGLVQRLAGRIHEARRHSALGPWVQSRRYGYVVLVDAPQRRALIQKAIQKAGLHDLASVAVAFAPTPITVVHALRPPPTPPKP
jgi:hypothetical protein